MLLIPLLLVAAPTVYLLATRKRPASPVVVPSAAVPVPPVPTPPARPFQRLALTTGINGQGTRRFALSIGDIISMAATGPNDFEFSPAMAVRQIDGNSGFGPAGPFDFLILAPGIITESHQGGSNILTVTS